MLDLNTIDHVGFRISNREKSLAFYELLGFKLVMDSGFEKGHPIVLVHPSGIVLNLLGPANAKAGTNVLMDEAFKYPGITHIAMRVNDADEAEAFMSQHDIEITGRHVYRGTKTIFIRDPDRTVLELVGPGPTSSDLS